MKNIITSSFLLLLLSSCASFTSTGMQQSFLYNNVKDNSLQGRAVIDNSVRSLKTGKSCTKNILALASFGDSSIDAAKRSAGITRVSHYEREVMTVLAFIYNKGCTIVHGE